jgi:hypothetical protein
MSQSANRILNALPPEVFAAMKPHLRRVPLSFAERMLTRDPLTRCTTRSCYVKLPNSAWPPSPLTSPIRRRNLGVRLWPRKQGDGNPHGAFRRCERATNR